ncbi:MAG: flagellar biosynthesis protein FlhF [Deltaproteobacteria bacterium]|nr:flagellar biosynthesis protein FlhF [Deltaproteobacteria bacterium]MBW2662482.1 flagellar biosynthesis protein FlhF [Deltaproteobacteria bacterium]
MQIKRYDALSITEAMRKIKADMGRDAIVLSSRSLNGRLEVVAARDDKYEILKESEVEKCEKEELDAFSIIRSDVNDLKSFIKDFKKQGGVYAELAEIKETMNLLFDVFGIQNNGRISSSLSKVYYHLLSTGISKQCTCALIEELKKDGRAEDPDNYHYTLSDVENMMKQSIASFYKNTGRNTGKKRISVFVGPAGDGKTTTLAKLAARCLFGDKLNIGIITMDTYRIGAVEQLKRYADIMGVHMEVASEKKELERVLNKFADKDVVLIDTPGKSRGDESYLLKLKKCFTTDLFMETNLVLSMTSSQESMMDAVARFGVINYDNIIFTKLDDSKKFGSIYNVIDHVGKPVFYVANGQKVPQDLNEMDPAKLARLIVGSGNRG